MIYMDHNATTPLSPRVLNKMMAYMTEKYGNPSSAHGAGAFARKGVEEARESIAVFIGAEPEEIHFTSGGTESNNLALRGFVAWQAHKGNQNQRPPVVITPDAHHSVLRTTQRVALANWPVWTLSLGNTGAIDLEEISRIRADTPGPIFLSVMHANNETGNMVHLEKLFQAVKDDLNYMVYIHVDACQTFGKVPIDVDQMGIDMLSMSAHKIYGPKGVGALYVREGVSILPIQTGGHQEGGLRAGTENVAGIVGFGAAASQASEEMSQEATRIDALRQMLYERIERDIPDITINTYFPSLYNTLNVSFQGVDAEALVMLLDQHDICVSQGSACEAGAPEPSHVLKAMHVSDEEANSAIRFSLGRGNTEEEVDLVISALIECLEELRG